MFSLWEFANEIDNPKNDDLVTIDKPNATNVEKTKSSVCLLEIADSVDFGKKNTPVQSLPFVVWKPETHVATVHSIPYVAARATLHAECKAGVGE